MPCALCRGNHARQETAHAQPVVKSFINMTFKMIVKRHGGANVPKRRTHEHTLFSNASEHGHDDLLCAMLFGQSSNKSAHRVLHALNDTPRPAYFTSGIENRVSRASAALFAAFGRWSFLEVWKTDENNSITYRA